MSMKFDSSFIRKVQEEIEDADEFNLSVSNMVEREKGVTQEQRELLMQLVMRLL